MGFNGSIIGIDPGVTGALAVIKGNRLPEIIDTPIEKLPTGKKTKLGNDKMRSHYRVGDMWKMLSARRACLSWTNL